MTAVAGAHPSAEANSAGLQPLLHDAVGVLRAPTQAWSNASGDMDAGIHGVYHSDSRVIRRLALTARGQRLEPVATVVEGADRVTFTSLLRGVGEPTADPRVRVERHRRVRAGAVSEEIVVLSALDAAIDLELDIEIDADFAPMQQVKAGERATPLAPQLRADRAAWKHESTTLAFEAPGAELSLAPSGQLLVSRQLRVPARGCAVQRWQAELGDGDAVVAAAPGLPAWRSAEFPTSDPRLRAWLRRATQDLDSLRMTRAGSSDVFIAAGAPWFFTLFGRDALWTARFLLRADPALALSTLRVLAGLQGRKYDVSTGEAPGKIMHELRPRTTSLPGEGVLLPPLYYGTIDATPLWACLLHDAWRAGAEASDLAPLLPHLRYALEWMRDTAAAHNGFLAYRDESGTGLANQGWKDSGDSIQWADGRLAEGPIALCEVQGYAYEAAVHAADLIDALAHRGAGDVWRRWAEQLRARFTSEFWIDDDNGGYPAIALDARGRQVDARASNMGHLLGTGILDQQQAAAVARLLTGPALNSGYGLRTLSTEAAGYWPLGYHSGSVWPHDTAIAMRGLAAEGFPAEAAALGEGLLAAAEAFDYRMPELYSGDTRVYHPRPAPYPAACRPQAWSAAAAFVVAETLTHPSSPRATRSRRRA